MEVDAQKRGASLVGHVRLSTALGGLALATISVSFLSQWYALTELGAGTQTDALFAGMVIPQLVLAIVSDSLGFAIVPLLATSTAEDSRREGWSIFQCVGLFFSAIAFVLIIFAPYWVPFLVPGFDDEGIALTIYLVRFQSFLMILIALNAILRSIYHARQRFVFAETSLAVASVISFLFLLWSLPKYGVVAVVWSFILRSTLVMLFLLPGMGAYNPLNLRSPLLREIWIRIRPLLIGTTYYRSELVLDRFLSSMAPSGGLSLLYFGQQIYGASGQILNRSIAAPMIPQLSKHAYAGNWSSFRANYRTRLLSLVCLTLVGCFLLLFLGEPILKFIFGRKNMTSSDIHLLWVIMVALCGMLIGDPVNHTICSTFYSIGDTKTPTKIGMYVYTIAIIGKLFAFVIWGIVGIAVAASLFYAIKVLILLGRLNLVIKNNCRIQENVSKELKFAP